MGRLPDELRKRLKDALGTEPPDDPESTEFARYIESLRKDSPALYRETMASLEQFAVNQKSQVPFVRTPRPLTLARFLYRQDASGNWVFDRMKGLALTGGAMVLIFIIIQFLMTPARGANPRPVQSVQASPPSSTPAPPVNITPTPEEAAPPSPAPPPPTPPKETPAPPTENASLPNPTPQLPPPPDYQPPAEGSSGTGAPITVVYSRAAAKEGGAAGGGWGAARTSPPERGQWTSTTSPEGKPGKDASTPAGESYYRRDTTAKVEGGQDSWSSPRSASPAAPTGEVWRTTRAPETAPQVQQQGGIIQVRKGEMTTLYRRAEGSTQGSWGSPTPTPPPPPAKEEASTPAASPPSGEGTPPADPTPKEP